MDVKFVTKKLVDDACSDYMKTHMPDLPYSMVYVDFLSRSLLDRLSYGGRECPLDHCIVFHLCERMHHKLDAKVDSCIVLHIYGHTEREREMNGF